MKCPKKHIERIEAESRRHLQNLESEIPFDSYSPDVFDVERVLVYVAFLTHRVNQLKEDLEWALNLES